MKLIDLTLEKKPCSWMLMQKHCIRLKIKTVETLSALSSFPTHKVVSGVVAVSLHDAQV